MQLLRVAVCKESKLMYQGAVIILVFVNVQDV